MVTGARRSIILFTVACCGMLAQDAGALTTEVALQTTRDPVTGRTTASLSVIANDVPSDCSRIKVFSQTRVRGERVEVQQIASVRVNPAKNQGKITLRFRHLPTSSSGKTEKVNFQVNCSNSAGQKTVSQSNGGTLNKCDNSRVVRDLAERASETKAAVIY